MKPPTCECGLISYPLFGWGTCRTHTHITGSRGTYCNCNVMKKRGNGNDPTCYIFMDTDRSPSLCTHQQVLPKLYNIFLVNFEGYLFTVLAFFMAGPILVDRLVTLNNLCYCGCGSDVFFNECTSFRSTLFPLCGIGSQGFQGCEKFMLIVNYPGATCCDKAFCFGGVVAAGADRLKGRLFLPKTYETLKSN